MKSLSKMLVSNHLNNDNNTAEELFAATNEQLHQDAKEWLMRTTKNCTILSIFIATVASAAAYTVPRGPNQGTGCDAPNPRGPVDQPLTSKIHVDIAYLDTTLSCLIHRDSFMSKSNLIGPFQVSTILIILLKTMSQ